MDAQTVLDVENDTTPIVWRSFQHPDEQFSFRAYPKGAWVLHMLRCQLGEDLFRRCVKTWLERHAYGLVVTEDLNAVIEELSGRSFDPFFDQWVYHAGHPVLEIAYSWDEQSSMARLSVKQTQALNDNVLLFRFPLPIRFVTPDGVVSRTLEIREQAEDFYVALPAAPQQVRVDPDLTVLAKMRIDLPTDLLYAQLEDPGDMLGRLIATTTLSGRDNREVIDRLKRRLNEDPFPGVRLEASKALREARTDEALDALLASTNQPDARVQQQVYTDLGAFYRESVLDAALAAIDRERNPDVLATVIRILASYGSGAARETLSQFLSHDSFRNLVADAAIEAMRGQDDPVFIPALLETLSTRESTFTTHGFGNALRAVAWLARNEESRDPVRTFLAAKLAHPNDAIRIAAIDALGNLGDPKALAKIEPLSRGLKESPIRTAALSAVSALRAERKPADDLHELRDEVLSLRQENRELKSGLDDLKKEFEERHRPEAQ
jgi:aminopeptidase N